MKRSSLSIKAAIAVTACSASAAVAAPTTVGLRVEGATQTLYEGAVTTDGKTITKDASGPHQCDGSSGGAGPGPTMTSALDDSGIAWAGTWFSFGDFGIDRIGPDANTSSQFWGYALNFASAPVGGCQQLVQGGDQVLFGYDYFSKSALLRLSGPGRVQAGSPFTVQVDQTDGNGSAFAPAAGATVNGQPTAASGRATLTIAGPGVRRLKADRADAVRSNALVVCAYAADPSVCDGVETGVPGAAGGPGAITDTRGPKATVSSLKNGRVFKKKGPKTLAGRVDEDAAIQQVYLRLRRTGSRGCGWFSAKRELFTRSGSCGKARFFRIGDSADWSYQLPEALGPGKYVLDVKALDKTLKTGRARVKFRVTK